MLNLGDSTNKTGDETWPKKTRLDLVKARLWVLSPQYISSYNLTGFPEEQYTGRLGREQ